jgi:histidyl-tRNA synthetase
LQPVRGTHDILPEEMRKHRRVIDTARVVAERYGYLEAQTPIFEFSDVFKRTLGDTSDIVTKEMYSFTDRGGEQLTLRPEGTASFARALISEGLSQDLPLKYFYHGPMFRYERPQEGACANSIRPAWCWAWHIPGRWRFCRRCGDPAPTRRARPHGAGTQYPRRQ